MSSVQSEIADLRERVARLERLRTKRGHCNKKEAAEYIGVSRETLRQLELRGEGPRRNPDGTYSFDALDLFKEQQDVA
jgi:DNA-binding XRE family transcriptional regulator